MAEHADTVGDSLNGADPLVVAGDSAAEEDRDDLVDEQLSDSEVRPHFSPLRVAAIVSIAAIVALACTAVWLGYRTVEAQRAQAQHNEFVEAARQGALNLTTIDYATVDQDVQRILDSSTGVLREDFEKRSKPFVEVVKQVHSRSEGTVTAAGLESQEGDQAQVLVSVSVKTSSLAGPEPQPRAWRMRIGVQKIGDFAKVSNVQFVP